MEFTKVGFGAFAVLGIGMTFAVLLPIAAALGWKFWKKERFTTILAGAATFLLFAVILEKPIQNALLFPTAMGLSEHAVSRYFSARPILLAVLAGLFPGVFEETGRLIAYKTVLKKRKNRETGISHGIGHGGFEIMYIVGISFFNYIVYAVMINTGTFAAVVEQTAAQFPEQAAALITTAEQIAHLTIGDIGLSFVERLFAFLFHVGASILVFYACRDRGKFWLYPLAVLLHTIMDFFSALYVLGVYSVSVWAIEAVAAGFGILTFCGAYFLLYRKDRAGVSSPGHKRA